jgi:hypothetical protein
MVKPSYQTKLSKETSEMLLFFELEEYIIL